jgi:hypothetical protein
MSSKVVDVDQLDDIFNIKVESTNDSTDIDLSNINKIVDITQLEQDDEPELTEEKIVAKPIIEEPKKDEIEVVDSELRELLKTCNDMVKSAKYLLDTSPDAETVAAGASMLTSVQNVIAEVNKSVLLTKKFKLTKELEEKKQQDRIEILNIRAKQLKPQSLGQGNTINVQNNNLIAYSQEDIVKKILAERNKT